jgi:hypothetical protein
MTICALTRAFGLCAQPLLQNLRNTTPAQNETCVVPSSFSGRKKCAAEWAYGQVRSALDKRVGDAVTVAFVAGAVRAVKSRHWIQRRRILVK